MSYDMREVGDYQKVYVDKKYPWPCISHPNRIIQIYGGDNDPDVLQRTSSGVFTCITGVCKVGILIPEEDIVEVKNDKTHLIMDKL